MLRIASRSSSLALWLNLLGSSFASVGCFGLLPRAPETGLAGEFVSPIDGDLRDAVATANTEFHALGPQYDVRIRWAGVLGGASYTVGRDPATGRPLRQYAPVIYAFQIPGGDKCYLSQDLRQAAAPSVFLARENLGGAHYGPPKINGGPPINAQGHPTGSEILCSGVDAAKGGVHVEGQRRSAVAQGGS